MRSQGGKEFQIIGDTTSGTEFVDSPVLNGKKYFYKVQSQLMFEGHGVDGGVSEVVNATPIDKTPPPPPIGVRAIQTATSIKVFWDPTGEDEVAGYRIYRRTADQKKPERIGEVEAAFTLFVDNNPPENMRVYYSITAFDQSEPANESDFSREATIR